MRHTTIGNSSRAHREAGASMVEYALLVALIAIVAVIAIALAGNEVSNTFSTVGSELGSA